MGAVPGGNMQKETDYGTGRIVSVSNGVSVYEQRSYKVVKANEIVQKARNDLTINQLKAFSFVLSKIKPTDTPGTWYSFSIKDYCRVMGVQSDNGGNYMYTKKAFKSLRDTSFWLMDKDGKETTVGYLEKVQMNRGSGTVRVKFDETLEDYLFGLRDNMLQYSLIYALPMKSSYSFNLYELLRSYAFAKSHEFTIEEFRLRMNCKYENFKDLRTRVIETAVREINTFTDLEVSWEGYKVGKKVEKIKFFIKEKDVWGQAEAAGKANAQIDGQMSLEDFESK